MLSHMFGNMQGCILVDGCKGVWRHSKNMTLAVHLINLRILILFISMYKNMPTSHIFDLSTHVDHLHTISNNCYYWLITKPRKGTDIFFVFLFNFVPHAFCPVGCCKFCPVIRLAVILETGCRRNSNRDSLNNTHFMTIVYLLLIRIIVFICNINRLHTCIT
jgi:hypothetical protein